MLSQVYSSRNFTEDYLRRRREWATEKNEVKELTPRMFIADAKQLVRWSRPKKLTGAMEDEDEVKT